MRIRAELLQCLAVGDGGGSRGERRDEVGHDIAQRYASLGDMRCHQLAELALTEMDIFRSIKDT